MTSELHESVTPFKINVPEPVLDDLRVRLRKTRWASDLDNVDESYGISTAYLRELVDYWADGFDWRRSEREMNEIPHHMVEIDGSPIHFMRQRGKGPSIPIILSHGWPWTFWFWSKVVGPLTDPASFGGDAADTFDVIVPSLPGFGFSTPVARPDMNFWKIADLFHELMTKRLGYAKYVAGGADYGALVTAQLGHKYAKHLYGIHLAQDLPLTIFQNERPWDLTVGQMVPTDATPELRAAILHLHSTYASHVAVHMLDGQTITHGLNDSPVGMLAWILQRWKKWSDPHADFAATFPRDFILSQATIYWVTQSIGSSIRSYRNAVRYPWRPSHDRTPVVEAPTGFTFLTGDAYPPGATPENRVAIFEAMHGAMFNKVYAKANGHGGHFSPWENASAMIEGIRETFRSLRDPGGDHVDP
jgi:pimeloyl-ACP methyl ester carboxylesterase